MTIPYPTSFSLNQKNTQHTKCRFIVFINLLRENNYNLYITLLGTSTCHLLGSKSQLALHVAILDPLSRFMGFLDFRHSSNSEAREGLI